MRELLAQALGWFVFASVLGGWADESWSAEVSGSIRYDGPLEGSIIVQAWSPKPGNRALRLGGKTGYAITDLTDLSGPELTIQFWFKGTSIQSAVRQQNGGLQDFEDEWNGGLPAPVQNPPRGWIIAGWNGFHLFSHDGLLNGIYYDPEVINDRWHHVAVTWKQNTKNGFASYMDGRLISKRDTRNIPIPNYNSPVYFGSFAGGSEFANGLLDEISIWKRALSETEISNSWHKIPNGNEPGLAGYWNFDDLSANDCSPSQFHGRLRGDASIVDAEIPGLGSPVLSTRPDRTGHYRLTNLVSGVAYRIVAFLDVNGNQVIDPWEPRSEVAASLLRADAKPMNLDLRLGVPVPFWRTAWFFGLSGFLFIAAVGGLAWYAQNRRMRRRFAELQRDHRLEQERWRIARDIHDELGAKLSRISYLSEVAKCGTAAGRRPELDVLGTAARELLATLDTIVWAMTPLNDTLENLVAYASQYAAEFFSMTGVDCKVTIPALLPDQPLTSQVRHQLLRVIQESLNNVLKHSGASMVILKFDVREDRLHISIADNGRGFDLAQVSATRKGGGNGLRIMRDRMIELGGELEFRTAPGQGAVMLAVMPMGAQNAKKSRKPPASSPDAVARTNGALVAEPQTSECLTR